MGRLVAVDLPANMHSQFLSTATRAQRLGATAVMDELPAEPNLWEILRKAARNAAPD